jgi:hypothetical protein
MTGAGNRNMTCAGSHDLEWNLCSRTEIAVDIHHPEIDVSEVVV